MIEFNATKSAYMSFSKDKFFQNYNFKLGDVTIPKKEGIIYLGLPLGDHNFVNDYLNEKMRNVEKSMFSLYPLGCKPKHMKPSTIVYLYKQFCQSIFRYHLDIVLINMTKLKELDTRQNILIKRSIGLNKFTRSRSLNEALKLESISELYFKHKLFFLKQINNNNLCRNLFKIVKQDSIFKFKREDSSFLKQLSSVENEIKIDCQDYPSSFSIGLVHDLFLCKNKGIVDSIKYYLFLIEDQMFKGEDYFYLFYELNTFLKIGR